MITRTIHKFKQLFPPKLYYSHFRLFDSYKVLKLKDDDPNDKRQVFAIQHMHNKSGLDRIDKELRRYNLFTYRNKDKLYVVQDEHSSFGNLLTCFVNSKNS